MFLLRGDFKMKLNKLVLSVILSFFLAIVSISSISKVIVESSTAYEIASDNDDEDYKEQHYNC